MSRVKDLTAQKIGRFTVIERAGSTADGRATWFCVCECGNSAIVRGKDLLTGNTSSCGCYRREVATEYAKTTKPTHRETNSRLYRVWSGMKKRCYDKNSRNYQNWGGRGITVCDEWRNSYETFRNWALEHGYDRDAPRGKCTLDRIDNNGNYEPCNCRWVDMKTQAQNRRPHNIGVKI